MEKIDVKNQKGIAATDSIIAVLIIILFTGIIMTLSYNIYLTSTLITRNSQASEYAIKIFEETEKVYYDDLTQEYVDNYINTLSISTGYIVNVTIETYDNLETEEQEEDVVKVITLEITYKLANKDKVLQMTKIKKRENLITPNMPKIEYLEVLETEQKLPIIYIDENKCKITTQTNTTWYNYDNGNWATILVLDDSEEMAQDDIVNFEDISEEQIYFWIPRYAYESLSEDLKFLYKNTNKYLNKENEEDIYLKLEEINLETYDISNEFDIIENQNDGVWLSLSEIKNAIEYPLTNTEVFELFNRLNNSIYGLKYWQNFFI